MSKKLNWEIVFERCIEKHDGKYGYPDQNRVYTGTIDKMWIICEDHGLFEQKISNHMNIGHGCPTCGQLQSIQKMTLSFEDFKNDLYKIHDSNIIVVGDFKNRNTQTIFKCTVCEYEWITVPSSVLSGSGCLECSLKRQVLTQLKPYKTYIKEVYEAHGENITILGEYKGLAYNIKTKCNICGFIWEPHAGNLPKGHGCPQCAGVVPKTFNMFKDMIKDKHNNNIVILGSYKGNSTPIALKCKICDYEWSTKPNLIWRGCGCPSCGNSLLKTHDQFFEDITSVHGDKISIVDSYKTAIIPIKFECSICDHIWKTRPDSVLRGSGCPSCQVKQSNGAKAVENYLITNNLSYTKEKTFPDCKNKALLRYDFYLSDLNILIEYDGEQHYFPIYGDANLLETQTNDKIKNEYASKKEILLIRIPYTVGLDNISSELDKYPI